MDLEIVAIQESFIDYPEHLSLVVFVKDCPWNCVDCQNKINLGNLKVMEEDFVVEYLKKSQPLFNHIVISGGEPTHYKGLLDFVKLLKELKFKIKLDTNGSNAAVLREVLPYLSAVSMDVKNSFIFNELKCDFTLYEGITRSSIYPDQIVRSIRSIYSASDYLDFVEFRTSVVNNTIDIKDTFDSLKSVVGGNLGKVKYTVNSNIICK